MPSNFDHRECHANKIVQNDDAFLFQRDKCPETINLKQDKQGWQGKRKCTSRLVIIKNLIGQTPCQLIETSKTDLATDYIISWNQ
jgi:hypothetical protein